MKIFKKHGKVNSFLRERPKLYDYSRKIGDQIFENRAEYYQVFKKLSIHFNGKINFVQIGANDGLRNDPMRDFIVRNENWKGILVEPLPYSFESLTRNYDYLNSSSLFFENVAVGGNTNQPDLEFWSYSDAFLDQLTHEQKEGFRRKSSLIKDHLIQFLPEDSDRDWALKGIKVKITSIQSLLDKHHLQNEELHLLAVDAEGYDREIIESTLADGVLPSVIYFESHHLPDMETFFENIRSYGYLIEEYRRDTIAVKTHLVSLLG